MSAPDGRLEIARPRVVWADRGDPDAVSAGDQPSAAARERATMAGAALADVSLILRPAPPGDGA